MISYKRKLFKQKEKLLEEINSLLSWYLFSHQYYSEEEYLLLTLPDIDILLEEYNTPYSHTLENSFSHVLSEEKLASFWLGYCVAKKIPPNTEIDYLGLKKECVRFNKKYEDE